MKSTKTVMMAMIVAFVAIGTTGFAMAGSTTATYVGSGDYSADWNGYDGDVSIYTHTPEGSDALYTESDGYFAGHQDMDSSSGWTKIERGAWTGWDGSTSTATFDNSGDAIYTTVEGVYYTYLYQNVGIAADQSIYGYTGDAVATEVYLGGGGDAFASVMTTAGDTATLVMVDSNEYVYIDSLAGAATDPDVGSASGQMFDMGAYGYSWWYGYGTEGTGYIIATGSDEVGFDVDLYYDGNYYWYWYWDGTEYTTYGTLYGNDTHPAGVSLYTEFDHEYQATGYIYAIDLN